MERPKKRRFTDKMEAFCLAYVETGNASEAYRRTYNVTKMAEKTVQREGWNLFQRPQIQERLAALREVVMDRHQMTVDTLLAELEEAREAALGAKPPQTSTAVSATMGKAKLLGLDKKIIELTGKDGGEIKTSSTVTVSEKVMNSIIDRL